MPDSQLVFKVNVEKQVDKRLEKLPSKLQQQIIKRIAELQNNPRPHDSIKLKGLDGYRLDMGDYRILYTIDYGKKEILVWRLMDRKEGYRRL